MKDAHHLSSTYALASVGIAAVHTLEAILPAAAGDVESASRTLADRFMRLVQNAVAQENIVRMLLEHIHSAEPGSKSQLIEEIKHESAVISKHIAEVTGDIVVGMQFQDRNTQIIENAARILHQYGQMLEDIRDNIEPAHHETGKENVAKTVESILSSIRIHEIRTHFVEALTKAKILHDAGAHAQIDIEEGDQDKVELF